MSSAVCSTLICGELSCLKGTVPAATDIFFNRKPRKHLVAEI